MRRGYLKAWVRYLRGSRHQPFVEWFSLRRAAILTSLALRVNLAGSHIKRAGLLTLALSYPVRTMTMSTYAKDLLELRRDDPTSAELRKMAMNIIAVSTRDQRGGC